MNLNSNEGLSVVIATLGGYYLEETIKGLMSGSRIPDEILLCIPDDRFSRVAYLASHTVKIILTGAKGQVRQRSVGFQKASRLLVLQLDDDIVIEHDTLDKLVECLVFLGRKNTVAPVYYLKESMVCNHHLQRGWKGFKKNLYDYFICAAPWGKKKMGVVTSLGLNYGVDDTLSDKDLLQTQWLPGGCVLSFRQDLITYDFFPFEGKAYCEDVYHSFYREQAGIKMWVATRIKVYIDKPNAPELDRDAINKLIPIRRKFLKMIHGSKVRMFFYELLSSIRSRLYT